MMTHDLTSFSRPQTPAPAFWRDNESLPFPSFRREMGRFFDDFFRAPAFSSYAGSAPFNSYMPFSGTSANWPVIQVKDTESEVIVTAEVPGLSDKDVELYFDQGTLTIRGVKKGEKEEFGYSELFYGRFERQIPLQYSVDQEHCVAEFSDGLLTVHLPKLADIEKKKKIPINAATRH